MTDILFAIRNWDKKVELCGMGCRCVHRIRVEPKKVNLIELFLSVNKESALEMMGALKWLIVNSFQRADTFVIDISTQL